MFGLFKKKDISGEQFVRTQNLYNKFLTKDAVTSEDTLSYAKNPATREELFKLLKNFNRLDLFPGEYLTIEKAAESNLVVWLEFPTELDAIPDEIEYVKKITIDFDGQGNNVFYHVFKFKVNKPHWAAEYGWMTGVVGPYFDDSKPYDFPSATFSRLSSKATPEEEVKWVHENIATRR